MLMFSVGREGAIQSAWTGKPSRRFLTVVVLSFLLLPVISMTDDLHAMATMAESERADLRCSVGAVHRAATRAHILPVSVLGHAVSRHRDICYGTICLDEAPGHTLFLDLNTVSDRAPPRR